uniref:Uncharacterized protein n=1 Tax=Chromera velia CCMP2878 TaxID=1169474 RepID=A0A0G4HR84_9ALVE|eukprot:Cvel_8094.t1-p1 / transcript=Cvel_8094.t1 / gene=Cvel_8094 / organism=Chromera_velia_CCMP2878 / gene_product=hypothetical protein / transcript_product=hypothetical protein / location=Cvel_scaffold439:82756-88182(+) / protein_length=183 / sequence_SO=supercontig / SO=protein_coding / is_pseudo=false
MVFVIFACIALIMGVVYDEWMLTPQGYNFYQYDRKYGAFGLSGAKRWTWFDFYETNFCPRVGSLMTFNQCSSPLCKYYQQKCFSFMYASYAAMTGQMFGSCCLATCAVALYCYVVPSEIGQINQYGDYPMPIPGISCFCMAVGAGMLFMSSVAACCLHRALREYDEDEDEVWAKYDRDDSDSD